MLERARFDSDERTLHNPETNLPAGSGDTPATNGRITAALGALNKQTRKRDRDIREGAKHARVPSDAG